MCLDVPLLHDFLQLDMGVKVGWNGEIWKLSWSILLLGSGPHPGPAL